MNLVIDIPLLSILIKKNNSQIADIYHKYPMCNVLWKSTLVQIHKTVLRSMRLSQQMSNVSCYWYFTIVHTRKTDHIDRWNFNHKYPMCLVLRKSTLFQIHKQFSDWWSFHNKCRMFVVIINMSFYWRSRTAHTRKPDNVLTNRSLKLSIRIILL